MLSSTGKIKNFLEKWLIPEQKQKKFTIILPNFQKTRKSTKNDGGISKECKSQPIEHWLASQKILNIRIILIAREYDT